MLTRHCQCWHIASFMARFQMAGDYLTLEMFGWPFFIIKDKDGNIVSEIIVIAKDG